MKNRDSQVGLIISIVLHSILFAALLWLMRAPVNKKPTEELSSISIEMVMATTVAEPEPEPVVEPEPEPEPEPDPEPIPDPKPEPPKPKKEKPKEKPKVKPKEKPKPKKETPPTPKTDKIIAKVEQEGNTNQSNQAVATDSSKVGQSTGNEISAYKAALQKALQKRALRSYPAREKLLRKTGVVLISFTVQPSGKLTNVKVVSSSGNSNLDNAAVKAAENTDIGMGPPLNFPRSLTIPIRYSIETK